jgi:hypothetical protein
VILDVATRTIAAAVLRPEGTKAVDAAVLLARMLVPEPMRPGWDEALAISSGVESICTISPGRWASVMVNGAAGRLALLRRRGADPKVCSPRSMACMTR